MEIHSVASTINPRYVSHLPKRCQGTLHQLSINFSLNGMLPIVLNKILSYVYELIFYAF